MHINKKITWSVTGIAFIMLLGWWAFHTVPLEVEVAAVTRGPFIKTVDDDGKTRVRERYVISAPLAGTLQRVNYHAGDRVNAGDVVATILPQTPALLDERTRDELQARVGAAEAAKLRANARVDQTQVSVQQATSELARSRKLAEANLISAAKLEEDTLLLAARNKELEAARADSHVAEHELETARAALREAMDASHRKSQVTRIWQVHAPVSGQVLLVNLESETALAVGQPIMQIGDPADLEVVIDVLTTDAVDIHAGAPVQFDHWGGQTHVEGHVRRVEPAAFTKISALGVEEQRVNVIVDITSAQPDWRQVGDSYKVDAHIVIKEIPDTLKAPSSALFRDQNAADNWFAYRVDGDRVRKTAISVGERNATESVLHGGLAEHDRVVVFPGESLKDGARVRIK